MKRFFHFNKTLLGTNDLAIKINADLQITEEIIRIHYDVTGNLLGINLPPLTNKGRGNELWKETCFEFFLAKKWSKKYFEFNFSPRGNWNAYTLSSYRKIIGENEEIKSVKISTSKNKENYRLTTEFVFHEIERYNNLEIQLAAIIKTIDNERNFFAITHPAESADFHLRKIFVPVKFINHE